LGGWAISGAIFISYRSAEDAYAAALLDLKLSDTFGHGNIFRASRSILPGESYPEALIKAVDAATIMLVIIGRNWLKDVGGRLVYADCRGDWMRKEIARAFELDMPVFPILLSGASLLRKAELPSEISEIKNRQYIRFEYRSIDNDYKKIRRAVSRHVSPRWSFLAKAAWRMRWPR
jgi:hypothetical protein